MTQPHIFGILNVTPDSFSDGGHYADAKAAVAHGLSLAAAGAHVVDVGGESTRPGAQPMDPLAEQTRILSVISALHTAGVPVSVDTMHAETARAAVAAGAQMINDVSGGLADPVMWETVAELDVDYILMHWRGPSRRMNELAVYPHDDVVSAVRDELAQTRDAAVAAGIKPERIIVDPGLGFAKTPAHNWELLRNLPQVQELGHRVLLGASRKRFLVELLNSADPAVTDMATAAVSLLAAQAGVWGLRVHDVAATRAVCAVLEHIQQNIDK